jgi:uncharacterized protein YbjQ (UPF0145 family)
MYVRTFVVCLVAALAFAPSVLARNDFIDLPAQPAAESALGKERLLDVPFYLAGQKHPKASKELGEFRTNKRSNAFGKSDEEACQVAFLSAIIALQERARKEGGNAVIDIRSITKHNDLASATDYRCVVGAFVANVALTGRVAQIAK